MSYRLTTLNLQNRNVLDYLTLAVRAHRTGTPAPSLLLKSATQAALAA